MKKKIASGTIIIITGVAIYFFAKSRDTVSPDTNSLTKGFGDELFINQFDFTPTGAPAGSNNILLNASDFLQRFGRPDSSSTEYAEMDETNTTHYFYNGADVWYLNDQLSAIELSSAKYCFQLSNGTVIKVGDNINVLARLFPKAWADRPAPGRLFIGLKTQTGPVDTVLLFEFDPNTNLILKISLQD